MKKIVFIIIAFVLFISCKHGQQTGFCLPIDKGELTLSSDWNNCKTIGTLFSWNISSDDWDASHRPFDTCDGMAVKVSGWIYNNPDGVTSGMFYLTDNPLYARPDTLLPMPHDALTIKSSKPFPASVDMTKKCFVSGHISIFQLHTGGVLDYGDDKACYVFIPNVIADSIFFAD